MLTNNLYYKEHGDIFIPYSQRTGSESVVYFTRDLSAQGLEKIYKKINQNISGKIAIKLHTGEANGPNIIPREWVKNLIQKEIPSGTIIETNAYYEGSRYTTDEHRKTLKVNGWTFCPVDIIDDPGTVNFPLTNGKYFKYMSMGKNLENYDSLVVLTHFKGHTQGGFGGSNKNIGIGCADGRIGKAMIHTTPNQPNQWDIAKEEFMERMTESTKAVLEHFKDKITFINVMRNMSVSCDCEGVAAEPVCTPNVGILGSTDILALDQACIDLIWEMKDSDNKAFKERVLSRRGLRQLTYMKELGMGNTKYALIDLDNGEKEILKSEAVLHVKPFQKE